MRKQILIVILALMASLTAGAQNIASFKLNNGLTVYVCEDPSQHDVLGEVVVRTGSVNDPEQYTGLAHYLEHVMFKGTQKIGALDWNAEKPIYEEIIAKYDELAETADEARREEISREINALTVKEGEISISQEYSNLIESIGGNGLNAGTSYDYTVYYNSFPANQINKWLALSSERFMNPVFRAFQSELETVYEEYNMYQDNPQSLARNFLMSKAFEGSPYSRDIIGLGEHLKNPRLSQLIKFYNDWYVPENMALIIAGNVKLQSIMRIIQATYGHLQPRPAPEMAQFKDFDVKGRVAYSTKFSYYPSTCLVFNGVEKGNPDEYPLEICMQLLSNSASTGFLDQLTLAGDVMGASAAATGFLRQGRVIIEAVPYYDEAQGSYDSNKKVEKYLLNAVNSIIKGEFKPETVEAIKIGLCRDYDLIMESNEGKVGAIADIFTGGQDLQDLLTYKDKISAVTSEDIVRVAGKYLKDNFIVINNELGSPDRKQKIRKPGYEPVQTPAGRSSEYATLFKLMRAPAPELAFVDWGQVQQKCINSYSKLYYSQNPANDIYTLQLKYGANSKLFPQLSVAAQLMNSAGVMSQYSFQQLKELFGQLGATFSISANDEYLTITLRGYESTLKDACLLITKLILMPSLDDRQLDNLKGSLISSRMRRKKNVNVLASALNEYILYGDESIYRTELTDQQIVDLDISKLTGDITKASNYAAEIHYSGNMPFNEVYSILSTSLPLVEGENPSSSPLIRDMKEYEENTVFFIPNSDAQQAQIYFYIPVGEFDRESEIYRMAFNQYFSGGFNGLVMQEIREKNSMAYTAYGSVRSRKLPGSRKYFSGYIGTQNDKAINAVELFTSLLTDMPRNEETMANIRTYLKETLLSQQPDVRSITANIAEWEREGYSEDPSRRWVEQVENLSFDDIVSYYEKNVKGKPIVIGIIGNPKDINVKDLARFGKVERLTDKKLFNENDVLFQK